MTSAPHLQKGVVLVTGGSGFVGKAVVRSLLSGGYQPRILARKPTGLGAADPVQVVIGDIDDLSSLEGAVRGCQAVIHCAADYRLALVPCDAAAMIRTNLGGTLNLLLAARRAGVGRVVHCSTVGTLAFDKSGVPCTELDRETDASKLAGPYKRSKWAAEQLALGWSEPQVVIVQPSTPVGSGDLRPTPTGATIRDFLRGRIPAVIDTGLNLVDVEAVGAGHVLALERGVPGRSYILGDQNLTLEELLGRIASLAGVAPPRWRVPLGAAYLAAVASEAAARLLRRPPAISLTSVRMASHPMWVDSRRARTELDWSPGNLARALSEAVAEFSGSSHPVVG